MENKKRTDLEECVIHYKGNYYLKTDVGYKKIILTTDQELIADGVQDIYDEFLQWFIKNPNCDFVNIIKNPFYEHTIYRYKIIIPQEEPKEVTAESIIQKTANSLGKSIPETFEIMENFSKDLDKLKEEPKQDKWDKLNKELDDALESDFVLEEPKRDILTGDAERYESYRMAYDENYCSSNDVQDLKESYYYKGRRDECIKNQNFLNDFIDFINNKNFNHFRINKDEVEMFLDQKLKGE